MTDSAHDHQSHSANPGDAWIKPAALAAVVSAVLLSGIRVSLLDTGYGNLAEFAGGVLAGVVVAAVAYLLVRLAALVLRRLPAMLVAGLATAALVLWVFGAWSPAELLRLVVDSDSWGWPFSWSEQRPTGLDYASATVVTLAVALAAGAVALIFHGSLGRRPLVAMSALLSILAAGWVATELAGDGEDPFPTDFSNFAAAAPGELSDPTMPGSYPVERLTYGAGQNPRRPDFGVERDLESRTVDARKILPEWKGLRGDMRERFWGFGLAEAPLNGRVYLPSVAGRYPLVLIVHGNHGMEDYSDGGYAYLGDLLASRGYVVVSVDQNYINGSWSGDFRGREMAARAWLLLEHLSLWRDWQDDPTHPLGSRVDLQRIGLVGHSRGGEAVSIAYAFNDLPFFPDDATVAFDYDFDIQSLVAIAQVDQRYARRVRIRNVNFLALQGSYDSDEPAFHGLRQYNRLQFSGDDFYFKAGIYIHGANHGQFNETWGRYDFGEPGARLLNVAPIIPPEDQRGIAAAYITAFMEATLGADEGRARYQALFRDPRSGAGWLPDHPLVQQYRDATFKPLATFDNDLNATTATAKDATISASGFAIWREEALTHRDQRPQGTNAVVLGWHSDAEPEYRLTVPEDFWNGVDTDDYLSLSISASTESVPKDDGSDDDDEAADDDEATRPPAFDIDVLLADGNRVSVASEAVALLAPPFKVRYLKHAGNNSSQYNEDWEPVLQYFEVPLSLLVGERPVADIREIALRFGRGVEGVVIVDDIGVRRKPDVARTAAEQPVEAEPDDAEI